MSGKLGLDINGLVKLVGNRMETELDVKKQNLKDDLINRLMKAGWEQEMRVQVQNLVNEKGSDKISIEDIVQEIAPKAKSSLPENIKKELMLEAKKSLKESDYV